MSLNLSFDKQRYGYVFNIQQFSIHDGPGIRTLVFLKGCPLECLWCSNPESQAYSPELAYNSNKCLGTHQCIRCIEICTAGAIKNGQDNKIVVDRDVCTNCFQCTIACPSKALNIYGNLMSVDEVISAVEKDSLFYARSGGGMSLSGGEPLLQADFAISLLKEAKRRRLDTTMETCGYAQWSDLEVACRYLNSIIYDIKCIDHVKHKDFTGVSNQVILENFNKLCTAYPDLPKLVRTPVVPGFNDNAEDINAIMEFIKDRPNVKYELLPYHRLGQPKYQYVGREYPLGDVKISEEKMQELKQHIKTYLGNL